MSAEERMDTEEEQESPNCEESDAEDSDHSSGSESESSDLDEETIDHRKCEYISDGHELEQAFQLVKNLLYGEKMKQINSKLVELKAETSSEYLEPLKVLNDKLEKKLKVAVIRRDLRFELIRVRFESESLAAHQNVENEKKLLFDTVKSELEETIRRLEEDRHNIDISSDLWESQSGAKKSRVRRGVKPLVKERKKRPTVVTSPYIIYMLQEGDIIEDWSLIKKALKQKQQQQKRPKPGMHHGSLAKDKLMVRYHDGILYYQGEHYSKGHQIFIDDKLNPPTHACITALTPEQMWVRKADGNKSKLYIPQLQKGKYTIRHSAHSRS